ncbi:MAG: hypothetical protein F6K35_40820 [Okeania sp. SIO2H7]|nr:hypothetical protein [Okeania sp. SIO2H7]
MGTIHYAISRGFFHKARAPFGNIPVVIHKMVERGLDNHPAWRVANVICGTIGSDRQSEV